MRLTALLLLFVILYGCNNPANRHSDKTVFRYNESSAITSLDPAFAKDQANIWACTQLYNGLVQLDSGLHVMPCIAKTWEIVDSGKTYLFHLREDVLFHEASPPAPLQGRGGKTRSVVAADFVYSLSRLVDSKVACPGAWVMNPVVKDSLGNLTGVVAIDDTTLKITLAHPFPPFLSILSMTYCSVIPKEVVEHYGADFRDHPCGTGPFKFKLWKEGVNLIFLKNENYFETKNGQRLPYLDAINVSFISDRQSAFIEFLKGNLDFLNSVDASYKDELLTRTGQIQSKHQGHFKMQTMPYLNTEHLDILMDSTLPAMKNSPLNNKLIRQALNYGFDRKSMMTYMRNNIGTPGIYGIVPPGLPSASPTPPQKGLGLRDSQLYAAVDEGLVGFNYNPAKTIALLNEAGYPDGRGLQEIVLSTNPTYLDLCEYIKTQWEKFGFKIRIDVNQGAIQRKMMAEQKLAMARASWIADYPDAENYLALFYSKNFAPNGPNYTHYSNKEYDELYEKASLEVNDSARYRLYQSMDKKLIEDVPFIILYYDQVVRFTQNNIEGMIPNGMNLLVLKEVKKK